MILICGTLDIMIDSTINIGSRYQIVSFKQTIDYLQRAKLISLGMIPGAELLIRRIAPLGNPVQVDINGQSLSIRKQLLNMLTLRKLANHD